MSLILSCKIVAATLALALVSTLITIPVIIGSSSCRKKMLFVFTMFIILAYLLCNILYQFYNHPSSKQSSYYPLIIVVLIILCVSYAVLDTLGLICGCIITFLLFPLIKWTVNNGIPIVSVITYVAITVGTCIFLYKEKKRRLRMQEEAEKRRAHSIFQ